MNNTDMELELNELEAVAGGNILEDIDKAVIEMGQTVIEAPKRMIDLILDLF